MGDRQSSTGPGAHVSCRVLSRHRGARHTSLSRSSCNRRPSRGSRPALERRPHQRGRTRGRRVGRASGADGRASEPCCRRRTPGGVGRLKGEGHRKGGRQAKKKKKEKKRRKSSSSSAKKKRKKDPSPASRSRGREKKKERHKEKEGAGGGKSPVETSSSSSTSEDKSYVVVDQKTMFGRSGLDPSRRTRNRVKRRAQKFAQRRKRSRSGSRSKSSGSEAPQRGEAIFGEPHKIRAVGVAYPGVLSAAAIEDMQELMLLEAGQETHQPEGWVPTLLRYYRQMLSRRVSGPMARELHTLCTVGDQVLRGQLPSALDTLIQRVKSLEAQIGGLPWASAHRLELLPSDTATLSTRQELRIATTEHKAETQAHQAGT